MKKLKIQIKSICGKVLFEYETVNNTIAKTLEEAIKGSADLRSADLRLAKNIPQDYINICSRDMLFIFQALKSELPYLRKKIVEGEIDGTQYEGDCACLIGSLKKGTDGGVEKVCEFIPFYDKGLHNPAEQWFWQIRKGSPQRTAPLLTML